MIELKPVTRKNIPLMQVIGDLSKQKEQELGNIIAVDANLGIMLEDQAALSRFLKIDEPIGVYFMTFKTSKALHLELKKADSEYIFDEIRIPDSTVVPPNVAAAAVNAMSVLANSLSGIRHYGSEGEFAKLHMHPVIHRFSGCVAGWVVELENDQEFKFLEAIVKDVIDKRTNPPHAAEQRCYTPGGVFGLVLGDATVLKVSSENVSIARVSNYMSEDVLYNDEDDVSNEYLACLVSTLCVYRSFNRVLAKYSDS